MALEDLTGTKYINSLNELWPDGAVDTPDAGDDHIRGIKNVLKKSFPNITGAVTLTHTQINTGSVPSGSVLAFMQAAAPTGWTRKTGLVSTFGMRIVATASAGGGTGGTDDPILNNKVPSHTHTASGLSDNIGDHFHTVPSAILGSPPQPGAAPGTGISLGTVNSSVTGTHQHSVAVTVNANASAANWAPRYYDFIVCIKD
jgi:hypothetical protein